MTSASSAETSIKAKLDTNKLALTPWEVRFRNLDQSGFEPTFRPARCAFRH